jgi:DNA-binding transcriptional LysR family regulator
MNFKQLETFAWTVRLGGFSAAARRLNTTQSSVSMRIQELERSLSVPLFESPRRATRLTPKGRELLEYAERILALASEAETRLGDPMTLSGRIRIGVGETIALAWLPEFIARLNEDYPQLIIESEVDLTASLWNRFKLGELELMLLPGPALGSNLAVNSLGTTPYAWMASPKLAIPERRPLMPADLERYPIITLSKDSVLHEITESWFRGNRAEPHRMDVCNSLGVVAALTMAGLGISMLPPMIYRREIERGDLMVLDVSPQLPLLDFISVFHPDREPAFIRSIAEIAIATSTFDDVPAPH